MAKKLPSFHFYPGDWFKDPGIMVLSCVERGAWFQMLLVMFESPRRGYLELAGEPFPDKDLAKMLAIDDRTLAKVQQKLIKLGVVSVENCSKIVFNRRMVRDEEIRKAQSNGGSKSHLTKKNKLSTLEEKKKGSCEDEVEIESEVEGKRVLSKSMKESEFQKRWIGYRGEKDARKRAVGYWNTSIKTRSDLDDYDRAEINYYKIVEASTFARSYKGGATWFNNWRDYIDQKPPVQPVNQSPPTKAEQKMAVGDSWLKKRREKDDRLGISKGVEGLLE